MSVLSSSVPAAAQTRAGSRPLVGHWGDALLRLGCDTVTLSGNVRSSSMRRYLGQLAMTV